MKEIIQAIDDGDNILLTGGAGVGKTYNTNSIIDHLKSKGRKFSVCALTGLASQHLHFGMTIHRFLGIGNKTSKASFAGLMNDDLFTKNLDSISHVSAIIIDEVSMMRTDLLELIDLVLKEARKIQCAKDGIVFSRAHEEPFGGYQMILVGDFCQLPPVVKKEESVPCKWIFQHEIFLAANFRVYNLLEVKRTSDIRLATMLNKIRVGYFDKESEEIIKSRANTKSSLDATVLMSRVARVHDYNINRLKSDKGDDIVLRGFVSLREDVKDSSNEKEIKALYHSCISESGLPREIVIKMNCRIMLLANNAEMDYSNGSQGKVIGMKEFDTNNSTYETSDGTFIDLDHKYFSECLIVALDDGREVVVPRRAHNIYGAAFDDKGRRLADATYYQYPIVLGYSVSIHKSQGMSLTNMVLDCSQIFADGQFYVGISRARSLEGISLLNFDKHYIKADQDAVDFYLRIANLKNGEFFNI
jgi:ATP-dependent exoDNAse (exonuclease V) alpha subunit